ncbi:MAG: hypothetical protein AB7P52_05685 [Alphaproteobacteria bacterium]
MKAIDQHILDIFSEFFEVFVHNKEKFECFSKHGRQLEGWFKGELIVYLEKMKINNKIESFSTEYNIENIESSGKVDFGVQIYKGNKLFKALIELKHLTDKQPFRQYFLPNNSGSYASQMTKMVESLNKNNYFLVFFTKNPGKEKWEKMILDFNNIYTKIYINDLTNPHNYPEYYFPALINIKSRRRVENI